DAFVERSGIVRANLRTNAIFQRRDELSTRRIVLRIGAEYKGDIKGQAHRISLNLHIAFLHDVEQTHLNLAGEIGQLIDGKNASIGARQQPVVHRQFAAEFMPAACSFNGIDIADQIRNRDIGSRQLFYVPILAQFADKIVAELILYTAGKETLFGEWTLAKFAERPRETHGDNPQGKTAFLT